MPEIPKPLQREEFRFTLIPRGEKRPYEKNWQKKNNYKYDDEALQKHIEDGGNYGVVCGHGDLTVIDADSDEIRKAVTENLPETLTIRTGGGGLHFYYICENIEKPIRLSSKGGKAGDIGDVQTWGKQVVGPNSLHPNGNHYEIENNKSIAKVELPEIKFALRKYSKKEVDKRSRQVKEKEPDIPITKAIDLSQLKQTGSEYYGPHPIHGSDTGRNFWVNPKKNQWHCFPARQIVQTKKGFKKIEDIKPGDEIAGRDGIQKVTGTFKRHYDGKLYTINTKYSINKIKITKGHPLLIARLPYKGKHLDKSNPELVWKNIEDIEPHRDYLVVDRWFGKKEKIDLKQYKNASATVPDTIKADYDLGYFIGIYLAEGHISQNQCGYPRMQLTMSYDELETAKELSNIVKQKFGVTLNVMQYESRGTTLVQCDSTVLSRFLREEFGTGSSKKCLGRFICFNEDFLSGIFNGWKYGDGYETKSMIQISTVSHRLATGMQHLMMRLGMNTRIYLDNASENNDTATHNLYTLTYNKAKKHDNFINGNDFIGIPIKSISTEEWSGNVYNLETTDHTYQIPFTVHNCFRHDTGGGPMLWLAVKHGIINCEDALPGTLADKNLFLKVVEKADQDGLIDKNEFIKDKSKEVKEIVSLENGQAEIVLDDLRMRDKSTRGTLHYYCGDTHRFEENRKISNQNMKQFCNYVGKLEELSQDDRDKIFKAISDMKDKARDLASEETAGLKGDTEEEEEFDVPKKDIEKHLSGEPLANLCRWTSKVHLGDGSQKIITRLSAYSRKLVSYPINLWPVGQSRSGKTHLLETMSKTIPNQHVLKFDTCSPKSMYYYCHAKGANALDGKVVFFNEAEASEEASKLLRGLTDPTKEENRLLSVDEQSLLDIMIEGLPTTWFTSVTPLDDNQLKNRFLFLNPDETTDHKIDITDHQMQEAKKGIIQPLKRYEFPILKAAYQHVIDNTEHLNVIVPFEWEWHHKESPHLHQFFIALVYTSAKLHYMNRAIIEDTIIANLDDYYIAKLVINHVIEQTMAGVKKRDLELYKHVPLSRDYAMTRADVGEKAQVSSNVARHSLERLVDADLCNKEKKSNAWHYWKSDKKLAKVATSISQPSLEPNNIKEVLSKQLDWVANENPILKVEGYFEHPTPSYMENLLQLSGIPRENAKELFEDLEGCEIDFTQLATSDGGKKDGEVRTDDGEEKGEKMVQAEMIEKLTELYWEIKRDNDGDAPMKDEFVKKVNEKVSIDEERIHEAVDHMENQGGIFFQPRIEDLGGM